MKAVVARNVSYAYPDGSRGVEGVTIDIDEGERVALLGPNGGGKTTFLLLLAGLIKPKAGHIEIFGHPASDRDFMRRNVGIIFQNPDDFLFNPTVMDELLYTPAQLDVPEEEARKLAMEFAEKFGLVNVLHKPPFRLSGGEKKKVALACVLMLKPRLLLLDEPTANVDGKARREILRFISDYEGTLITATHELWLVPEVADRVIILNRTVMADGGLDLLEDDDLLERSGIA
ncbi:energy-coupling factor ABC transporter ATP-binding protein [Archaeoglobus veneficus]|uniref:Sulfate-transporting ATPase n=1 Tax=Archaeoglobus veneficus (strain DSM 11195 / SNP6) TaxID=693661 RepID=F2KQZ8_ARCVS|nr:ABC transporter ATP-binding protein [Archaeoglobus veneficus]AEA47804.1 Sulfate-transporting ATPase [Archaeoglobus veneficus SNP6]